MDTENVGGLLSSIVDGLQVDPAQLVKTTVVGIGNVFARRRRRRRGGLVQRLALRVHLRAGDRDLDGGTLGLGLVTYLSDTDRLLIIDAAATGAAPGQPSSSCARATSPAILRATLSAHEASLCDLLAALTLLGRTPGEFVAIGIEPQNMTPSIELSSVVHDALERAEA